MTKIYLILFFLFSSLLLFSNCRFDWLEVWLKSNKINLNSIFVINGYYSDSSLIKLGAKHNVYLKTKNDTISLKVVQMNIGEYGLVQVVLTPNSKLKPNTTYRLFIKWTDKGFEYARWRTNNHQDLTAPIFSEKPQYANSSYMLAGCGPESFVFFKTKIKDKSDFLIKVSVTNPMGKTSEFLLMSKNDTISVGHDMCRGAFALKEDGKYDISFDLMDSSGNKTNNLNNKLYFVRPKSIKD